MKHKRPSKSWLADHYLVQGLSENEIGRLSGCTSSTVSSWLKHYGIAARPTGRAANHVVLSDEALAFLEGNLLGDGFLDHHRPKSARYNHGSKHQGFLAHHIAQNLSGFGIKQSGQLFSHINGTGFVTYSYTSLSYRELLGIHSKWYKRSLKTGKLIKHVPLDIVLSSTLVREWFLGDGSLEQAKKRRSPSAVKLHTNAFSLAEVERLAKQLQAIGVSAKIHMKKEVTGRQPIIVICDLLSIKCFFEFIGPCPDTAQTFYGYKWPDPKSLRNHTLKVSPNEVREIRCLQLPQSQIAKLYGISRVHVSQIKTGARRRAVV